MSLRLLLTLAVLYGATSVPAAVSLTVRPAIMLQRGDIRVEVRVPRHADNRVLAIAWSSDHGTEGSTLRPLDGDDAAVLHTLALASQPAANYVFIATVFGSGGRQRGRADARIVVPDDGGDPAVLKSTHVVVEGHPCACRS